MNVWAASGVISIDHSLYQGDHTQTDAKQKPLATCYLQQADSPVKLPTGSALGLPAQTLANAHLKTHNSSRTELEPWPTKQPKT